MLLTTKSTVKPITAIVKSMVFASTLFVACVNAQSDEICLKQIRPHYRLSKSKTLPKYSLELKTAMLNR